MTTATVSHWRCIGGPDGPPVPCSERGEGPGSDKAAERHCRDFQHATHSMTTPKEGK